MKVVDEQRLRLEQISAHGVDAKRPGEVGRETRPA
jgi:hypothetical protein